MQKRVRAIVFVLMLMAVACKNNSDFTGDHLSPKVMQKVLLDIHLAEAYSTTLKDSLHRAGTKNTDSLAVFYKDIFNHYHITEQQFDQSLNWYKDHPEEMDTMYTKMIPVVVKWQAEPIKR